MHTTVSDGTDSPSEILSRVKKAGIELFAVTDHDSFAAVDVIRGIRKKKDPAYLSGIEFSCKDEEGKYHILGYGFDPEEAGMRAVVEKGRRLRLEKVQARLVFLGKEFGIRFPEEDLEELFAMECPGKPHIANLLIRHGYATDKKQAFNEYLNLMHLQNAYVRPEEAIQGILGGGGIPVLAHPAYGDGDELILGEELEERVERLVSFGLQGMEGFYSGFTPKIRREVIDIAERNDLYITAGSDYHGTNKMVILGDTGLDAVETLPEGLLRFIKKVKE